MLLGPSSELNVAAPAPKEEADVVLLPNGCLCCKVRCLWGVVFVKPRTRSRALIAMKEFSSYPANATAPGYILSNNKNQRRGAIWWRHFCVCWT